MPDRPHQPRERHQQPLSDSAGPSTDLQNGPDSPAFGQAVFDPPPGMLRLPAEFGD